MKIDRPLWAAGALLSQQQFQQQARWEAWSNDSIAHLSLVHPWGVQAVDFDLQALSLGKLKAALVRVRLPDGTLIDTDHFDRLPPALELSAWLANAGSSATIVLALPLEQANGNNCLFDGVEQRPDLGALHTALSSRLTQSGGGDAAVSQHSAPHESVGQNGLPCATAIRSGRDLLDSGRGLAGYLREQPLGWLAAHRLMKSLRWDTVHQLPPQNASGHTRLAPPRGEYRAQLKRLSLQQSWNELLDQIERMYAEGVNHFWLDLQWYLCQALSKQPAPQDTWADIVKRDLGMFLERLPGIEELRWSDGTPFADETTREWISQQVNGNRSAHCLPAPAVTASLDADIVSLETEAQAQADSEGVEQALAWLSARPDVQSGRQRWLMRLLMARVAERYGKAELALHLLGELDVGAQRRSLCDWEPDLEFEVKARLLKLLRLKAQRSDADKSGLARRMESLLAALVAMDPVRAAVLCN